MKVLDSTLAFKCERYTDGMLRKIKARFCCRRYQQVYGIDYFVTFAPIVSLTTVRMFLVSSVSIGLDTKQFDYTCSFIHEPITVDECVIFPRGFDEEGKVKNYNSLFVD